MGVKHLWKIIEPLGGRNSLLKLEGKQVALDLSCWVFQSVLFRRKQNSYFSEGPGKCMRFRNIFWRIKALLLFNVVPICVLDGNPPNVKHHKLSSKGNRSVCKGVTTEARIAYWKRTNYKLILEEYKEMLDLLGLTCLWSIGEGEALCGLLDKKGFVDGVITEDSDAFLYGARKIYRNFSVRGSNAQFKVFDMDDVEKELNLSREKLIALSFLCGSDYESGVQGIGPQQALKYLSTFKGDILERLSYLKYEEHLQHHDAEGDYCETSHSSRFIDQTSDGCEDCEDCGADGKYHQNQSTCAYHNLEKKEKERIDIELKIREKIMLCTTFPVESAMKEYMYFSQELDCLKFEWKQPEIVGLLHFMKYKCRWTRKYTLEMIMPIFCRWALLNASFSEITPIKILRERICNKKRCFDLQWAVKLSFDCSEHKCLPRILGKNTLITIEPKALVIEKCEELYRDYVTEVRDRKKLPKKKS